MNYINKGIYLYFLIIVYGYLRSGEFLAGILVTIMVLMMYYSDKLADKGY